LRATAQTSNGDTTLRSQADLVHAYLDILSMRMGPRLKWTIDVPAELANVALPPSLLQPIVENAVKHGLEPKIEGGAISLTAKARDGVLELVVTDTGAGFRTEASPIGGSTNLGLAVLKERLSLLYGDAASLVLVENRPTGVKATLRIPLVHEH
jgi:sensor histidine kinase YesM